MPAAHQGAPPGDEARDALRKRTSGRHQRRPQRRRERLPQQARRAQGPRLGAAPGRRQRRCRPATAGNCRRPADRCGRAGAHRARAHAARCPGSRPEHEGDQLRTLDQREDRQVPPDQHLSQARGPQPHLRDALRLRAQPHFACIRAGSAERRRCCACAAGWARRRSRTAPSQWRRRQLRDGGGRLVRRPPPASRRRPPRPLRGRTSGRGCRARARPCAPATPPGARTGRSLPARRGSAR